MDDKYKLLATELAEYLIEREEEDFRRFIAEGGDPEDHVFSTVCEVLGFSTKDYLSDDT